MNIPWLEIIFALLFIDSIGANLVVWLGSEKWYKKEFRTISRLFPMAKGWTGLYLALVLFIGYLIYA